jgi:hypothetical protein
MSKNVFPPSERRASAPLSVAAPMASKRRLSEGFSLKAVPDVALEENDDEAEKEAHRAAKQAAVAENAFAGSAKKLGAGVRVDSWRTGLRRSLPFSASLMRRAGIAAGQPSATRQS